MTLFPPMIERLLKRWMASLSVGTSIASLVCVPTVLGSTTTAEAGEVPPIHQAESSTTSKADVLRLSPHAAASPGIPHSEYKFPLETKSMRHLCRKTGHPASALDKAEEALPTAAAPAARHLPESSRQNSSISLKRLAKKRRSILSVPIRDVEPPMEQATPPPEDPINTPRRRALRERFQEAREMLLQGNADAAEELYRPLLDVYPLMRDHILRDLARIRLRSTSDGVLDADDAHGVLTLADRLLAEPATLQSGWGYYLRGRALAALGDLEGAERAYTMALADPSGASPAEIYFRLGEAIEAQGRKADALVHYRYASEYADGALAEQARAAVARLEPRMPLQSDSLEWSLRRDALSRDVARRRYTRTLKRIDSEIDACTVALVRTDLRRLRGICLARKNRIDAAIESLETVFQAEVEQGTPQWVTVNELQRLYRARGDAEKRRALLRRYISLSPTGGDEHQAYFLLALLLREDGKHDEADALYESLRRLAPSSPEALDAEWRLAWGRYLRHDYPGAKEALLALTRHAPPHSNEAARAWYWLSRTYETLGHHNVATVILRKLSRDFPDTYYAAMAAWRLEGGIPPMRFVEAVPQVTPLRVVALTPPSVSLAASNAGANDGHTEAWHALEDGGDRGGGGERTTGRATEKNHVRSTEYRSSVPMMIGNAEPSGRGGPRYDDYVVNGRVNAGHDFVARLAASIQGAFSDSVWRGVECEGREDVGGASRDARRGAVRDGFRDEVSEGGRASVSASGCAGSDPGGESSERVGKGLGCRTIEGEGQRQRAVLGAAGESKGDDTGGRSSFRAFRVSQSVASEPALLGASLLFPGFDEYLAGVSSSAARTHLARAVELWLMDDRRAAFAEVKAALSRPDADAQAKWMGSALYYAMGSTFYGLRYGHRYLRALARLEEAPIERQALASPMPYRDLIVDYARERRIRPALVAALIQQESIFDEDIRSRVGALGLMQLMPYTAREVAGRLNIRGYHRRFLTRADFNLRLGTQYLREMLDRYDGRVIPAIASYNAGPEAVDRWMARFGRLADDAFAEEIPYRETRNYVRKVLRNVYGYMNVYGEPRVLIARPEPEDRPERETRPEKG